MKIMQINCVYNTGSTGKIVYDLHTQLKNEGHESVVVYGRGKKIGEKGIYRAAPEWIMKLQSLRSRITGYIYGGCILSTKNIIAYIKKENPDVVHLHCINAYMVNIYQLLCFLKKENINTVLTLHAEFMHTAGCGYAYECNQWIDGCLKHDVVCPQYNKNRPKSWLFHRVKQEWNLMKEAFDGFDNLTVCSVSDWLRDRAKRSGILYDKHHLTVKNGVDTSVFKIQDFRELKEKHMITEEKVILHVTPNFTSEIKGGRFVLELAEKYKNEKVKFIIVGFHGDRSALCDQIIGVSHTNTKEELAKYYSMADVTLLTSKKETFSMICAESLCCGTPMVGFEAGAPETISLKEYSQFSEYGNVDKLKENVDAALYEIWDQEKISEKAVVMYDKRVMYENYLEVYKGF